MLLPLFGSSLRGLNPWRPAAAGPFAVVLPRAFSSAGNDSNNRPPDSSSPASTTSDRPSGAGAGGGSGGRSRAPPLQKRVLHVRTVSRTTSGGKIRTSSALVVVGNGNGLAGYGEGRGKDNAAAILKATRVATKNMVPVARFEHRTVFGDIALKHHSVNLEMRAAPPGYGVVANNNIHEVCRCAGITDLSANVRGSVNPINVVKATFEAFRRQRNPADIARARGKRLADVVSTYYGIY
ncbi:28S ribosomal protein S5, mitochondrial [Cladochytrium tenue]|nr:28S ribosomal protein S5, mitochondrial [Cladochytrium tenue]